MGRASKLMEKLYLMVEFSGGFSVSLDEVIRLSLRGIRTQHQQNCLVLFTIGSGLMDEIVRSR